MKKKKLVLIELLTLLFRWVRKTWGLLDGLALWRWLMEGCSQASSGTVCERSQSHQWIWAPHHARWPWGGTSAETSHLTYTLDKLMFIWRENLIFTTWFRNISLRQQCLVGRQHKSCKKLLCAVNQWHTTYVSSFLKRTTWLCLQTFDADAVCWCREGVPQRCS